MSECVTNTTLGRVGCGATFTGEMQHCVAKVAWSEHADGMAHITGRLSSIEKCWKKGGEMVHPASVGLVQDDRGVWRAPISDEQRASLAALREGAAS